ncbi:hypothetical protein JR316_0001379 [Psilocybe cubensis]|uniref:Uncharacterized protein n=2 Tax=Psilocybe cubensis TaxID=181762 RepID=A0ACB8HHU8_PSICU|nr:hypothetical protein JR316_0001379 [Psilocybe cubensis]KAH9487307.1 hypothetical protein JR316_0001379 [Psilocybe cubensis]
MASSSSTNTTGRVLKRAHPSTIQDKFLVGYQGWFTCHGDGEPVGPGHHGWLHWFNYPIPDGGRPNTDVWPDVSSYSPSELYPAPGLKTKAGEPVFLFSSRNAKTVQRHFHWMAEHGVDGAFLQRFAGQCDLEAGNEGIMRIRDEVGERVREAAEKEGRVFAIMYDVSGVAPDRIQRILERDWVHLIRNKGVLDSPNYLREKGKPVVALWGFGFDNSGHTPELVHAITQFFRDTTPGGAYIMGGTPASWRTAEGDADRNPNFLNVWLNDFDAISPWTIGRYCTEQEADGFAESKMKGDVDMIKRHNDEGRGRKVDYIPVVFPGGSGCNLSEGKWGFNNIKRNGGRFLWKQIFNAKRLGVRTLYGAMWDEYDEGTAFMPIVEHKRDLPESDNYRFMALDEDGYDVPSDWFVTTLCFTSPHILMTSSVQYENRYMRICGFAGEGLRSERRIHETFPVKELQDYWSSRPRYEEVSHKSGDFVSGPSYAAGSVAGAGGSGAPTVDVEGQSYAEWLAAQKEEKEELPPPPYSLEAEEEPSSSTVAPTNAAAQANVFVPAATPLGMSSGSAPLAPVGHTSTATMANAPQSSTPHPQSTGSLAANSSGYVRSSDSSVPIASGPGAPQHHQQDPIANLTHGFERQSISDSVYQNSGGAAIGGNSSAGTSSPTHTSHSVAYDHAHAPPMHVSGRHSRPSSQSGTISPVPRPSSQQNYQHNSPVSSAVHVRPSGQANATGSWSQGQWPPPDWNVRPNQTVNAPPSVPHSTYPTQSGGANLTRPQSFSASSNVVVGASLRPNSTISGRPSSAASNPISAGTYTGASNSGHRPASPYSRTQSPPNTYNSTPYPPHSVSPYPPKPSNSPHPPGQTSAPYSFPNGPSYPPTASAYSGEGGTSYPGQSSGSGYQPMHGSNYTWSSGPSSHASPPHSPLGVSASSFPAHSTYSPSPYNPSQPPIPQQYTGPSFPSSPPGGSSPYQPQSPDVYFPQAQAPTPGAEGSYYGHSNNVSSGISMPTSSPSAYPYPSQYGSSTPSFPGPNGPSNFEYPQPATSSAAWGPPSLPPRPPTHSGYGKPSNVPAFPSSSGGTSSVSSGFGKLALSAVDKVAGKKTREQLESQVAGIAQTGNKLFNKYINK